MTGQDATHYIYSFLYWLSLKQSESKADVFAQGPSFTLWFLSLFVHQNYSSKQKRQRPAHVTVETDETLVS